VAVDTKQLNNLQRKLAKAQCLAKAEQRTYVVLHQKLVERIFQRGLDAGNARIGLYSDGYLKRRQKMNYPASRKVILQATTQMLDDFKVIPDATGWGHGFSNDENANKSRYVEETYNKSIFELTGEEEKFLFDKLNKEINKCIGS
jgi:hypothetical protein